MSFQTRVTLCFAFLLVLASGLTLAAASTVPWLHVEVQEKDGTKVNVQVPLSLARLALDLAGPEANIRDGRIRINGSEIQVPQIRKAWLEIRDAGERELVSVVDADQDVKVARKGEHLVVEVTGKNGKDENVLLTVPTRVVDALFSGEGDELDLDAALASLGAHAKGELVRVSSSGDNVRIWME